MFFSKTRPAPAVSPLKPFLLRTREGYLVGLAMEPQHGSPCVHCVQGWLEKRGLGSQLGKLDELKIRRDILAELMVENSAHVLFEIDHDGTVTRLKSPVFPLPGCGCSKNNYLAPSELDPASNYSFSPLTQIKCVRYVTPDGHLWLTSASGNTPLEKERLSIFGASTTKAGSRSEAIDEWLKQAALSDLRARTAAGEAIPLEVLQTGNGDFLSLQKRRPNWESVGAGKSFEEATLKALYELSKQKILQGYATSGKSPMLVVGANNWLRQRVPYFLLQEYDLHMLFYPNASPCWVTGIAAFSRMKSDSKPVFLFSADADINVAMERCLAKLLEWARPESGEAMETVPTESSFSEKGFRLNLWWTHWIYRCSKIALKDVLNLEAYPRSVQYWRDYVRDGQPPVSVIPLNHPDLPAELRTIVKLVQPKEEGAMVRKVIGIGTLSPFHDGVH